ncbi:MAG: uroporphyrinogen-III C-methyltransferase [bacterium]|nr:uroporphyrinogen-III C-methyltransferase [bacterium]
MNSHTNKKGFVYLVGAGPGDPELITKRGIDKLKVCDAVVYDRLAGEQLLSLVSSSCEKINVGKRVGNHPVKQEEINQILVRLGQEGKTVVRLKGGDSFVFGRGGEEILALEEEGIGYELVPGVTSAIAVPELAGIPVTHRGAARSFHVITGHTASLNSDNTTVEDDQFEAFAKLKGTLVFLMGVQNIDKITEKLMEYGKSKDTLAAVISNGASKKERVVRGTLQTISQIVKEEKVEAPAIIVIGDVAGFSMKCQDERPLAGCKVGITGTRHMVKKLTGKLENEGAHCIDLSYSNIEPIENAKFETALQSLGNYTWVVLTSTNGVHLFFKKMKQLRIDQRELASIQFAVIGKGTEDTLEEYGYYADYMPEKYTTLDLANGLVRKLKKEDRLFIPRAKNGSPELTKVFKEHEVHYDDIKIYEMKSNIELRDEKLKQVEDLDYITFASAEGVRGFFENLQEEQFEWMKEVQFACIGEVTAKTLLEEQERTSIVSKDYTATGLAKTIISHQEKDGRQQDEK